MTEPRKIALIVSRCTSVVRRQVRLSGLIGATLMFTLAMTPSLMPRGPVYMGAIAGVAAAAGYGVGVFFAWLVSKVGRWQLSEIHRKYLWRLALLLVPIGGMTAIVFGDMWQNEVRELVGVQPLAGYHILVIFAVAMMFAAMIIGVARFIRLLYRALFARLVRRIPPIISVVAATFGVVLLLVFVLRGILFSSFVRVANFTYSNRNDGTPPGISQTTLPERSGSSASYVNWNSLGYMGRGYIGAGVTRTDIEAWSGRPAKEPIMVYVGLESASSPEDRAALALAELKRTGAFERKYLTVITPTGTGWIEQGATDALAYTAGGDVAMASIQYSYLPSWISFMVDRDNAREAGKALYDQIYEYWRTLPADRRPQLVAYGLSLGSFGGQAAFSGLSDLQARTEGAIFVGTPHDSEPWNSFVARRDLGSPEILPVYQGGKNLRFIATNPEITADQRGWEESRILYMQHASDPVVWWSLNLLFSRPDWLSETPGFDRTAEMYWIPVVTFLQVSVDQFFATTVPNGHGHNYANTMVAGWDAVLRDTPWTDAQLDELQEIIAGASSTGQ